MTIGKFRALYDIDFSEEGSNRRREEEDSVYCWELFLQESASECSISIHLWSNVYSASTSDNGPITQYVNKNKRDILWRVHNSCKSVAISSCGMGARVLSKCHSETVQVVVTGE